MEKLAFGAAFMGYRSQDRGFRWRDSLPPGQESTRYEPTA